MDTQVSEGGKRQPGLLMQGGVPEEKGSFGVTQADSLEKRWHLD